MKETHVLRSETLAQRLARGPLEPDAALDILRRLLKTLAFVHWSGGVNGNVTPKNIVISPDGEVDLTGTKAPAADDDLTPAARASLDPRYMAPEQISGLPADARADVFVVGVVAYEMLTGQYPFAADKAVYGREVMSRIVDWPSPQLPPAVMATLPEHVGAAVNTALNKNREARFATAEVFLEALRDREAPVEETETPATAAPPRKRNWLGYIALAVVVVGLLFVVIMFVLAYTTRPDDGTTETTGAARTTTSTQAGSIIDPRSTSTTEAPTTTTTAPTTTTASTSTTLAPAPVTTRVEDTAAGLTFTGAWVTGNDAAYSGGSFQHANGQGAAVTASFSGTSLTWIAKKGPSYGKAKVTLDGASTFTVDLYDAQTRYQQPVWKTGALPDGLHTVAIEWTGTKNAAASGTNISVDAFDIAGSIAAVTRFEQTDPRLVWIGAWKQSSNKAASGGNFKYADASGTAVTVNFTGERLGIIAKKGPAYGEAKITLDGTATFTVDLYSATEEYGLSVWSSGLLTAGDHTVKVEWTGTKNAAATAANINLDAVDVIGTLR